MGVISISNITRYEGERQAAVYFMVTCVVLSWHLTPFSHKALPAQTQGAVEGCSRAEDER